MKYILLVLLVCSGLVCRGQDQVKLRANGSIVPGKVTKATWSAIKIVLENGKEVKYPKSNVDSVYVASDEARAELEKNSRFSLDFISKRPLMDGDKLERLKLTGKDTLVDYKMLKLVNEIHKAGDGLQSAGGLMIGGAVLTILGTGIATNKFKLGMGISVVGGLASLVGVINIVTSGSILSHVKAGGKEIGLSNEGIGLKVKF